MYLVYWNSDDCPSEKSMRIAGKGRTLEKAVSNTLIDQRLWDDYEEGDILFDNDHIYVDGNRYFDIKRL